MKYITPSKQIILIIILIGIAFLFFPFTLDFVFSSQVQNVDAVSNNSNSFSINYFQHCYRFIDNLKYPYKFPYIEVLGILMVLFLPISILMQLIFFIKNSYKKIIVFCIIALLFLSEFGYYNFEYLQYGYYLLFVQQVSLLFAVCLKLKNKNGF
jgi:hypothetical protein